MIVFIEGKKDFVISTSAKLMYIHLQRKLFPKGLKDILGAFSNYFVFSIFINSLCGFKVIT